MSLTQPLFLHLRLFFIRFRGKVKVDVNIKNFSAQKVCLFWVSPHSVSIPPPPQPPPPPTASSMYPSVCSSTTSPLSTTPQSAHYSRPLLASPPLFFFRDWNPCSFSPFAPTGFSHSNNTHMEGINAMTHSLTPAAGGSTQRQWKHSLLTMSTKENCSGKYETTGSVPACDEQFCFPLCI